MATVQNDSLTLILRDLVTLRDNIYAEFSQIADELIAANVEPTPIPDVYVRIPSFSRPNVAHVVRTVNGKGYCACESATFHPERLGTKGCIHFVEAKSLGYVDPRAVFAGGLG